MKRGEFFGPHLERPSAEMFDGRRFSSLVSTYLTIASQKLLPAEALGAVRRKLACRHGITVSEKEVAALNHRYWRWAGRHHVPTYDEAMKHVESYPWVPH